jgi:ketosteroid isomerase-like protein
VAERGDGTGTRSGVGTDSGSGDRAGAGTADSTGTGTDPGRGPGPSPCPPAIAAYFAAVNARDWDRLAHVFADDAEIRPPGVEPRRGRDDVLAYYPPLLATFAEHHDEPTRIHVAGDVVTVEIAFTGRTVEGAPLAFDAVDVFDLDAEGRIVRLSLWYDTRSVIRQLKAGAG